MTHSTADSIYSPGCDVALSVECSELDYDSAPLPMMAVKIYQSGSGLIVFLNEYIHRICFHSVVSLRKPYAKILYFGNISLDCLRLV